MMMMMNAGDKGESQRRGAQLGGAGAGRDRQTI